MSMEYEYVDESLINDNLKCSICNDPFEEAVTTHCDHTFCYNCIKQWISTNNSCPTCRSHISNIKELTPVKSRLILNMLNSLLVKCKICDQTTIQRGTSDIRCPWIGKCDELSLHLNQCPYEQIRPILTEILIDNNQLQEKIDQITEYYEKKIKKLSKKKQKLTNNDELELENEQLKEQINDLNQKYEKLKNEMKINSSSSSIIQTITFESLLQQDRFGSIPNGYAGLNWHNVRYTNEENAHAIRPNKKRERFAIFLHGYSCVAYNNWKLPIIISCNKKQNFTFHSCEIMSVNHSEEICKLNIIARKDKVLIYSKTVTLKRETLQIIQFDSWNDINEIEFYIENTYFILTWIKLERFSQNKYL